MYKARSSIDIYLVAFIHWRPVPSTAEATVPTNHRCRRVKGNRAYGKKTPNPKHWTGSQQVLSYCRVCWTRPRLASQQTSIPSVTRGSQTTLHVMSLISDISTDNSCDFPKTSFPFQNFLFFVPPGPGAQETFIASGRTADFTELTPRLPEGGAPHSQTAGFCLRESSFQLLHHWGKWFFLPTPWGWIF